jgi:hypothetical protein
MDTDKKRIIEKLKTIKDPVERDRLMWALSGLDKETGMTGHQSHLPEQTIADSQPETDLKLPTPFAGIRNLFVYFVPGLFILFGISNLLGALSHIFVGNRVESVIRQLIMGTIFLLIGFVSLKKAKKRLRQPDQETDSEKI